MITVATVTPPTNVKNGLESSSEWSLGLESSSTSYCTTIMGMCVHESEEKEKVEQVQEGQSEFKGQRGHDESGEDEGKVAVG